MEVRVPAIIIVMLIIGGLLAHSVLAAAELPQGVPLYWKDTGKEIKPGYKITISVKAEGSATLGGLADAGFMIDQKKFGITQDGTTVYLLLYGHLYKIDDLPYILKKQYSAVFEVTLYCPGTAPPGDQPQPGYLWMEVYEQNYGKKHYYLVKDPGPGGEINVYYWTEENPFLESVVDTGEPWKFSDCGDQYGGEVPGQNDDQIGYGDKYKLSDLLDVLGDAGQGLAIAVFVVLVIILLPYILSGISAARAARRGSLALSLFFRGNDDCTSDR